jgi:hypothetical protein
MKIYFSALLMMLSITFSAFGYEQVPCWFNNPVTKSQIGFVGTAIAISAKKNGSLIASRKRSLLKLIEYYQYDFTIDSVKDFTDDFIVLSDNISVYFAPSYVNSQIMYSYAYVIKEDLLTGEKIKVDVNKQCNISYCDFDKCEPAWLCESKNNSINSASQITSNPAHQLQKTLENAQQLIKYLNKSHVDETSYKVKSTGQNQNWQVSNRRSNVDSLGDNIPLLNTHSCVADNYLFARYSYVSNIETLTKPFSLWIKESNIGERNGVVGMFNGIMADGRFSSAIKFAIKDGLIELAKTKEISINNEYEVTFKNGWYSLSKTTEVTSATVSARLMDLKVTYKDSKLVIYAWLLENQTKGNTL